MDLENATASLSTAQSRMISADITNLVHSVEKLLKLCTAAKKANIPTNDASRSFAKALSRFDQDLLRPISSAANNGEIRLAPMVRQRVDILASRISGAVDHTVYINSKVYSRPSTLERDLGTVAQLLVKALDEAGNYDMLDASYSEEGGRRIVRLEDKKTARPIPLSQEVDDVIDDGGDDQVFEEDILASCPRFRILVLGRSGTGKSSLINHTFKVDIAHESDYISGVSDINVGITSPKNDRFILHDSQGFEQGELDNLHIVKDFIRRRNAMTALQDRIHAVWLCIQIPFAGGRLLEKGDEEFLKANLGLPIVVVFTKDDIFRVKMKKEIRRGSEFKTWPSDESAGRVEAAIDKAYETLCVEPLKRLTFGRVIPSVSVSIFDNRTLENLVKLTSKHAKERLGGGRDSISGQERPASPNRPARKRPDAVWLVWAVAQRASADLNIEASIAIGQKRYWRALACSFQFSDKPLQTCLDLIHKDIVDAWNFRAPNRLCEEEFKKEIRCIAYDLADDSTSDPNKAMSCGVGIVTTATGLAGGLSGPAAPVVIPIAASVALGYYLYTVYKRTPPVIRVLMGYIINLTTILEGLFNLLNSEAPSTDGAQPQILSSAMITRTIENYNDFKRSEDGWRCHSEIRNFVRDSHNIFSSDYRPNVSRELIRLMQAYRFRVVQEWMDKVKETE